MHRADFGKIGLTYGGAWSKDNAVHDRLTTVQYNGSLWMAQDNVAVDDVPGVSGKWALSARGLTPDELSAADKALVIADAANTTANSAVLTANNAQNAADAAQETANNARAVLTADLTLYVDMSGDDTNNGLTPEKSLRNIQTAIDKLASTYDTGVKSAFISVGAGTYTEFVVLRPMPGSGLITIEGAGKGLTVIRPDSTSTNYISTIQDVGIPSRYELKKMTVQGANAPQAIGCHVITINNSWIQLTDVELKGAGMSGQRYGILLNAMFGGVIGVQAGCSFMITTNDTSFVRASEGGKILFYASCQFNGSVTWSVLSSWGGMIQTTATHTGNVAGERFRVDTNSLICSGGQGPNAFPGNAAGVIYSGGIYE